jgi:hypothetical protein
VLGDWPSANITFWKIILQQFIFWINETKTLHKGRGANFAKKDQILANKPNLYLPTRIKLCHFKSIHNLFAKKNTETRLKARARGLILCLVSVERFLPPSLMRREQKHNA